MEGIVPVNMILLSNCVQLVDPQGSVDKIFDLKGSWNNRIVGPGENQTKKDRNFLACKKNRLRKKNTALRTGQPVEEGLVQFSRLDQDKVVEQIKNDVDLLQRLRLLDYSLLFAVESLDDPASAKKLAVDKDRHRYISTCGRYCYHISIIDYLTQFDFAKKIESFYKTTIKGANPRLVSAVNPDLYAERFIKFMTDEVIVNEKEQWEQEQGQNEVKK